MEGLCSIGAFRLAVCRQVGQAVWPVDSLKDHRQNSQSHLWLKGSCHGIMKKLRLIGILPRIGGRGDSCGGKHRKQNR
jgi:hypothetical protein